MARLLEPIATVPKLVLCDAEPRAMLPWPDASTVSPASTTPLALASFQLPMAMPSVPVAALR